MRYEPTYPGTAAGRASAAPAARGVPWR